MLLKDPLMIRHWIHQRRKTPRAAWLLDLKSFLHCPCASDLRSKLAFWTTWKAGCLLLVTESLETKWWLRESGACVSLCKWYVSPQLRTGNNKLHCLPLDTFCEAKPASTWVPASSAIPVKTSRACRIREIGFGPCVTLGMTGSNSSGASAAVNETLNTIAVKDTTAAINAHMKLLDASLNGVERMSSQQLKMYVDTTRTQSSPGWEVLRCWTMSGSPANFWPVWFHRRIKRPNTAKAIEAIRLLIDDNLPP